MKIAEFLSSQKTVEGISFSLQEISDFLCAKKNGDERTISFFLQEKGFGKTNYSSKIYKKFAELVSRIRAECRTKFNEEILTYDIILEENPENKDIAWLGIGFIDKKSSGIMGKIVNLLSSFKKPNISYEPKFNGVSSFIYDLLWWLVLISISVALVNMLPVGIFDGGRFFYLAVLSLTKNEKIAKKSFTFSTFFILFLLLLIMDFWALSFFK